MAAAPSSTDRIEKSIQINATAARVWKSLTDYKEFNSWFGIDLESPFTPGKVTRGRITHPGYEHIVVQFIVEKIEAPTYFSYRWHPYPIDPKVDYTAEEPTLVEFHLEPTADGKGTLLRVTESGFDNVPAYRRDEAFRMNSNGWAEQLKRIDRYAAAPR